MPNFYVLMVFRIFSKNIYMYSTVFDSPWLNLSYQIILLKKICNSLKFSDLIEKESSN